MASNLDLFNAQFEKIEKEVRKRRSKWTLTSLHHLNYDDISQILLIHVYHKMHLWDQKKPIEPWLNTVISNQITNLIRNNYANFVSPCLNCEANTGENACKIYGEQCSKCPPYKIWEKGKKNAYNIKLPTSIEKSYNEINNMQQNNADFSTNLGEFHILIKKTLTSSEWRIYECLYIKHFSDKETAEKLNLKASKNQGSGNDYKRIRQVKKIIIEKARKVAYSDDFDIPR